MPKRGMQEKRTARPKQRQMVDRRTKNDSANNLLSVFEIDIIAGLFCLLITGAEAFYHLIYGNKQFGWQQVIFAGFTVPLFIMLLTKQVKLRFLKDLDLGEKVIKLVMCGAFIFILILSELGITFVLKIKLAIQEYEIILFYIDAGISEEMLFRVLIATVTFNLMRRFGNPIAKFFSVVISSFSFMLGHYFVYGQDINLMIATLVGGFVLGIAYVMFDNLTAAWIAHVVYDATTSGIKIVNSVMQIDERLTLLQATVAFCVSLIVIMLSISLINFIKLGIRSKRIIAFHSVFIVVLGSIALWSFMSCAGSLHLLPW